MVEVCALVAAAGRGTRAGLPYPKTLFPVQGKPILVRIAELVEPYDPSPTVIVSPDGREPIQRSLAEHGRGAHLVVQPEPRGMGDAVLRFVESPAYTLARHVLLVWGDIPLIQAATVATIVNEHLEKRNDFTFATRHVDSAYTVVSRSSEGKVLGIVETRESSAGECRPGERDIGLFVFRKQLVLDALLDESAQKYGRATGEHGFLYVIGQLASRGFKVEALPIATAEDLVSLNRLDDLNGYA